MKPHRQSLSREELKNKSQASHILHIYVDINNFQHRIPLQRTALNKRDLEACHTHHRAIGLTFPRLQISSFSQELCAFCFALLLFCLDFQKWPSAFCLGGVEEKKKIKIIYFLLLFLRLAVNFVLVLLLLLAFCTAADGKKICDWSRGSSKVTVRGRRAPPHCFLLLLLLPPRLFSQSSRVARLCEHFGAGLQAVRERLI